ncbi:NHL repeat containing protein [Alcanivorax nanhaiticus]|uniref:NHL repeat containing protein n=1 Tax=Alcanivorax nanhaiticus TaxID=1177154 RepID=A0A095TV56_9GAMM|nr:hypothetical protein [Alcanivorax nanhaiticus]KGD66268.1 NHL repeat containing protein [Alcanivorax nanhaiticus]
MNRQLHWITGLTMGTALTLAGCGGNGSSNSNRQVVPASARSAPLLVMHNGSDNKGQIDRLGPNLAVEATFQSNANEGMVLDLLGNLYAASDISASPSQFQVVHRTSSRPDEATSNLGLDREVDAPGSANLKGVAIAHQAGLIFAANVGGNSIEVYGTAAGEEATPLASTSLPGNAWDLVYNETLDRAFLAMTNGTILVIDNYVAGDFSAMAARTITPGDGMAVSNIHGIAYRADIDTLVVTDVADPGVADDGKIFVISSASTAEGMVTPDRTIAGPSTLLGNPVDLILEGNRAFIAEKSNDAILVYNNIFAGESGDIAPSRVVDSVKPEALIRDATVPLGDDVSDIDDTRISIEGVLVTSNPPLMGQPDVVVLDTDLSMVTRSFTVGGSLESVSVNQLGDVYLTADNAMTPSEGSMAVINRLGVARDGEMFSLSRDRMLSGENTGLVSPKGFDIADGLGLVLVTDNGDPAVKVFGAQAGGNVAPLYKTTLSVAPWDLDYDPDSDTLYVALVNGTVAVFEDYSVDRGTGGPDRTITPTIGGMPITAPTNLHGIVYVADRNALIVSDVGSGANGTDGKLYVIERADRADGNTPVAISIDDGNNDAVGNTQLGNPVDIAWDGSSLYVAEKSQKQVLRFDNLFDSEGGDVAPDASFAQNNPESVVLLPDYLAPARDENGLLQSNP